MRTLDTISTYLRTLNIDSKLIKLEMLTTILTEELTDELTDKVMDVQTPETREGAIGRRTEAEVTSDLVIW